MKAFLLFALLLAFGMSVSAQERTYVVEFSNLTLNSVSMSWHRADGTSDIEDNQYYTPYYIEYGIKGFGRGQGLSFLNYGVGCTLNNLIPDTEYALFIRKKSVSADSPVWFEEYNFKTVKCNTEVSNIKTEMEYVNGITIRDLLDIHITFDKVGDAFELEYGMKGFEKGSGTIMKSDANRFSIGNANLQSKTEYDFYIRAKCNDVYGEWSEKNSFATTDVFHYPGDEAFDVYFENITNKSVSVQWRKIVGGAYPRYFIIEYGQKGFERGTRQIQKPLLDFTELSGLEADTEYSFFIRGGDKNSTNPVWFAEHTFKTYPCNTEISKVESMELWTTCICDNGAVGVEIKWEDLADSYELEYGLKGFQQGMGETIEVGRENYAFIPYGHLTSHSDYDFFIRAECNGGYGEWTKNSFSTTQLNTSIENINASSFAVFPNPVEDILHIKINSTFDIRNVIVYIIDLTGSIRYKSEYKDNYNISSLSAGTYIVRIMDNNYSETMIIQKK